MLFALEWIRNVRSDLFDTIEAVIRDTSLESLSRLLTMNWMVVVLVMLIGLGLCFWGFRIHRYCHGLASAVLLGVLGWALGHVIPGSHPASPAVFAVLFFFVGFFVFSLGYFANVFVCDFLLMLALFPETREIMGNHFLWLAFFPALVACIFYVKYKLVCSALFGAVVLSLLFYRLSPWLSLSLLVAFSIGGIVVQLILKRIYDLKRLEIMREQIELYPYGPGLAYGWEDPTLKHYKKLEEQERLREAFEQDASFDSL